jgi:hypothetical protein
MKLNALIVKIYFIPLRAHILDLNLLKEITLFQ